MKLKSPNSALASFLTFSTLVQGSPVSKQEAKQYSFTEIVPSQNLQWFPCKTNYSCAMLQVPLDYSKPQGHKAAIPIIRLAALPNSSNGPYKGIILTNPGGPGTSGVDSITTYGTLLQSTIGTNYDIIAFDPRGIGHSIPLANCSAPPSTLSPRHSPKLTGPYFTDSFYNKTLQTSIITAQACEAALGGDNAAGPHMTTTVNARDMLSIVDAFAKTPQGCKVPDAKLVNYWGFSYGTYIGHVFASMFPSRVGRFVLDGVVDANTWVTGLRTLSILQTDESISQFFDFCHAAGKEKCSFATGNSARDLKLRFEKLLKAFDAPAAAASNQANAAVIEVYLEQLKGLVFQATYYPIALFPILSDALLLFEKAAANPTPDALTTIGAFVQGKLAGAGNVIEQSALPEGAISVICSDGDGSAYGETLEDLKPYIKELRGQSVIAGDSFAAQRVQCSVWGIKGVDRYVGPFGGRTRMPILFVSNTVDTVTPIVNGQKWAKKYSGARLLTINGVGHTSVTTLNNCGFKNIGKYFQTGKLPAKNTVCPAEKGPFGVTLPSKEGSHGH